MKLNALLKTLGFLALAATPAVAGTAPAPKNPVAPAPVNDDLGINASLGYDSSYVWRGVNFGSNWVRAGVDGSILLIGGESEDAPSTSLVWDFQYGFLAGDNDSFTPNFPGAVGAGLGDHNSFQRFEFGAAFAHDLGPVVLSLGYRYYYNTGDLTNPAINNFGNGGYQGLQDGQEVQLGLKTSLGPIDIASSANYDWVSDGWYFDATASTTIAITDAISFVPSFNVGYAKNYTWQFTRDGANTFLGGGTTLFAGSESGGDDISGWAAANIRFSLPIKLNSRATLVPYIALNVPLGALQNVAQSSQSSNTLVGLGINPPSTGFESVVYGGVTLSIRF
ncbi:MAG: hypothetical protein IAE77_13890 [Prosthecobacter sp.]|uniref:hypothetical protein n=1 Tax=Prosthecobacter sp. TaxID=1965333 RepID=UPI0019EC727A|nr:hypothetical protein [Prosthecobacter sp.]MBE2284543.1 hypothetical protein [Prosthecobacter sp.]